MCGLFVNRKNVCLVKNFLKLEHTQMCPWKHLMKDIIYIDCTDLYLIITAKFDSLTQVSWAWCIAWTYVYQIDGPEDQRQLDLLRFAKRKDADADTVKQAGRKEMARIIYSATIKRIKMQVIYC